jgi:hypothetical protein
MFQARWNGHLSEPLIFRTPATISLYKQPRRRYGITVLTVRQRGLMLRIFVPDETVAPCYNPTATETFSS